MAALKILYTLNFVVACMTLGIIAAYNAMRYILICHLFFNI